MIEYLPPICFAAGFAAGLATEKEHVMYRFQDAPKRVRGQFERHAFLAYLVIAALALTGIWFGVGSGIATGRLVECLRDHAAATTESSQATRDASEALTTAQKRAARKLQAVLEAEKQKRQKVLFEAFKTANGNAVAAYVHLETVRDANPVPDPPAEYCRND